MPSTCKDTDDSYCIYDDLYMVMMMIDDDDDDDGDKNTKDHDVADNDPDQKRLTCVPCFLLMPATRRVNILMVMTETVIMLVNACADDDDDEEEEEECERMSLAH